jgi:hypothetical protein
MSDQEETDPAPTQVSQPPTVQGRRAPPPSAPLSNTASAAPAPSSNSASTSKDSDAAAYAAALNAKRQARQDESAHQKRAVAAKDFLHCYFESCRTDDMVGLWAKFPSFKDFSLSDFAALLAEAGGEVALRECTDAFAPHVEVDDAARVHAKDVGGDYDAAVHPAQMPENTARAHKHARENGLLGPAAEQKCQPDLVATANFELCMRMLADREVAVREAMGTNSHLRRALLPYVNELGRIKRYLRILTRGKGSLERRVHTAVASMVEDFHDDTKGAVYSASSIVAYNEMTEHARSLRNYLRTGADKLAIDRIHSARERPIADYLAAPGTPGRASHPCLGVPEINLPPFLWELYLVGSPATIPQ